MSYKLILVCLLIKVAGRQADEDIYLEPTCLPEEFFVDLTTTLITYIPTVVTSSTVATHKPTITATDTVLSFPTVTRWKVITVTPLPQFTTLTSYIPFTTYCHVELRTTVSVTTTKVTVTRTKTDPEKRGVTFTSPLILTRIIEVTQTQETSTSTNILGGMDYPSRVVMEQASRSQSRRQALERMLQGYVSHGEEPIELGDGLVYPRTITLTTCGAFLNEIN